MMAAALLGAVGGTTVANTAFAGVSPDTSLGGAWSLTFCWAGSGCGSAGLDVIQSGNFLAFKTNDGGSGAGLDASTVAIFHFVEGCLPNYIAENPTSTSMSGVMKCSDGSGGHGTWSAVKVGGGVVTEASGAISASGVKK
jgi:hypothetical protein